MGNHGFCNFHKAHNDNGRYCMHCGRKRFKFTMNMLAGDTHIRTGAQMRFKLSTFGILYYYFTVTDLARLRG
jgi:hypothetical protein